LAVPSVQVFLLPLAQRFRRQARGALLSYILIGLMVYFLMTSLGELAAFMPVSGSFATYGQNYVEEGFGFALGWNYWYNWAVTIAVDLVAAQLVMSYWFPDTPGWIWSACSSASCSC
jgi:lysine-specific permease